MTKKSTATIVSLVAIILIGFFMVSSLFSSKQNGIGKQNPAQPQPTTTLKPLTAISPAPTTTRNNLTPGQWRAELTQAQTLLDQIKAAISAGDWAGAQNSYTEFEYKTRYMPAPQLNYPDISPLLQDFFDLYKVQLTRSIGEQNALQATVSANQLYGIVSEQRARFGTRDVPLEFQRLHFLIREIEIWSQSNDEELSRVRIRALRDAWKDVRSVIVARRNGAEQVKHFDELVEKLQVTGQSAEIAALIPDFHKELERINGFLRLPRSTGTSSPSPGKTASDD
ncbi:MAG TPA: hypothetical protein VJ302_00160 [Blastocatellia bacterium]|nr:hypothetical protein [Blastocatellia bacterium]